MNIGDLVVNANAWQGEILEISPSARFGAQVLVQYASRREWENQADLYVVVSAPEREAEDLIQPGDSLEVRQNKELRTSRALLGHLREEQALARWGKERTPAPKIRRPPR
jgi:hypothetical protein